MRLVVVLLVDEALRLEVPVLLVEVLRLAGALLVEDVLLDAVLLDVVLREVVPHVEEPLALRLEVPVLLVEVLRLAGALRVVPLLGFAELLRMLVLREDVLRVPEEPDLTPTLLPVDGVLVDGVFFAWLFVLRVLVSLGIGCPPYSPSS